MTTFNERVFPGRSSDVEEWKCSFLTGFSCPKLYVIYICRKVNFFFPHLVRLISLWSNCRSSRAAGFYIDRSLANFLVYLFPLEKKQWEHPICASNRQSLLGLQERFSTLIIHDHGRLDQQSVNLS